MTDSGKTCSDVGLNIIVDEGECKKAVEFLERTYRGNERSRWDPSGCYAYKDHSGYFNKHESGTGNANVKSICKKGVYQFIHNQSWSNKVWKKYLAKAKIFEQSLFAR